MSWIRDTMTLSTCDLELTPLRTGWNFLYIILENFCEKWNAFIPLGIGPRTFRLLLPVEYSII